MKSGRKAVFYFALAIGGSLPYDLLMIGFPEIILLIGLVAALAFEVVMLVVLWRSSASANKKILWTALMIMFNPLAAIVYCMGFRERPGVTQPPTA